MTSTAEGGWSLPWRRLAWLWAVSLSYPLRFSSWFSPFVSTVDARSRSNKKCNAVTMATMHRPPTSHHLYHCCLYHVMVCKSDYSNWWCGENDFEDSVDWEPVTRDQRHCSIDRGWFMQRRERERDHVYVAQKNQRSILSIVSRRGIQWPTAVQGRGGGGTWGGGEWVGGGGGEITCRLLPLLFIRLRQQCWCFAASDKTKLTTQMERKCLK